ncbi:MAG TPA: hypothetical protein VMU92_13765 [Acidobacteriaceae bacterium]|nr:hypothetical protein [Acidobacteriaceae bacterium]
MDANSTLPVTLARTAITAIVLGLGITPLFIDLNRTHATHPLWPGHARFHVVWQTVTTALECVVEVALLWWPGPYAVQRFYLAAVLAALPLLGFLAAMATRRWYGGTLRDPEGVKPVRIRRGGRVITVDMNAVLVVTAAVILLAAVLVY